MKQTVKELLFDAVKWDEPYLAHAVYYAVQQNFVTLEDLANKIPYEKLDHQIVMKMRDDNVLSMSNVKLFTVPMGSRKFAFYLAEKEDDARAEHHKVHGVIPYQIINMTEKMDTSVYCEETKKIESFREMKQNVLHFPYFAGCM
ncbi:hypothetical protein [Sporosarcina sp. FSL K6-5500]|uniref:hypothetical protein n=1 Tax=Sporosarcina sp. FSL K6-5500 TaxID=2921558 RepID=UPI0030F73C6A